MSDSGMWREAHIGFEGDGLKIGGIDIWKHKWCRLDLEAPMLPHPAYPHQIHRYTVYETGDDSHPVRFAASELSNGVWGFYVPKELSGQA